MDLIKELQSLGYTEQQATEIATKSKKVYFQEDMDSITGKVKSVMENKIKSDYVSKTEYDLLVAETNKFKSDLKNKQIKDIYIQNGGNEKYFDDFLKINDNLLNVEEKDLNKSINDIKKSKPWAFNNEPTLSDFGINETSTGDNEEITDIYGTNWNEILNRGK